MEYTPLCFGSFEEPTCLICPFLSCCKDLTLDKLHDPKSFKEKKQTDSKSKKPPKKHKKRKLSIIDA